MAQKRRKATNSDANRNRVASQAHKKLTPPGHIKLTAAEKRFYQSLAEEFAVADVTDHMNEVVALMARCMAGIDRNHVALQKEGDMVVLHTTGREVENPRHRVIKSLTGDLLSYRRTLALHARASEPNNAGKNRKDNKETERQAKADKTNVTDLFAKPE